ncbi:MAG: glutathione S-transferase family protein [Vibrio sp.]
MITLHHLNQSRSKRIIWLLEALDQPYQIKAYQRDAVTHLAPAELKQIHPLGKSPVIEDDGLVIAESGAIVEYLVEKYAADSLAPAKGTPEYAAYLQWLHFAESSGILPLLLNYFLKREPAKTEFLEGYSLMEAHKILAYLNQHLTDNTWLIGDEFSAADILNSFVIEIAASLELLTEYPALQSYLKALMANPQAQKANQLEQEYA